ncbi:MAG TPA: lmo0937 family membrane protein [Verrucomicrobiae bacterium]|nr:lmo0937 family membrane protein [Verrucomicrobiae bacterium]
MGIFTLIGIVVVVLWLVGLLAHIGGAFINLLLIVALVLLIANFLGGHSRSDV